MKKASGYPTKSEMYADDSLRHIEVFHVGGAEAKRQRADARHYKVCDDERQLQRAGWYYWFSLPGCLPDSSAFGPYSSELAAVRDAFDTFYSH